MVFSVLILHRCEKQVRQCLQGSGTEGAAVESTLILQDLDFEILTYSLIIDNKANFEIKVIRMTSAVKKRGSL